MGTWFLFKCLSCDYTAEVSGREDTGMFCRMTTIFGEVCKKLYDVEIENML